MKFYYRKPPNGDNFKYVILFQQYNQTLNKSRRVLNSHRKPLKFPLGKIYPIVVQILIVYLPAHALLSAKSKSHFLNRKLYPKQIVKFKFLVHNDRKWQAELAMDDRYFHSALMYVSFNMPFFVV